MKKFKTINLKTAKGDVQVRLPEDATSTPCTGCNKDIFFADTKNGKKMPISQLADGSWVSHFYDCPKAKDFKANEKD